MEIICRLDQAIIRIDHCFGFLHLSYDDFPAGEAYMVVMEEMVRQSLEQNISAWLIDASQALSLDPAETDWKAQYFANVLERTPVRKIARVISPNIMYEARLNSLKLNCTTSIELRFFTCELAALAWLQETLVGGVEAPALATQSER